MRSGYEITASITSLLLTSHTKLSGVKKKTLGINNRLQNSPYFCVFKYARVVKQKVWDEAENRERDWGETRGALRACKTLTPRLTDFFTDFEEKTDCFAV